MPDTGASEVEDPTRVAPNPFEEVAAAPTEPPGDVLSTDVLGVLFLVAAAAYLGTGLVKQALFRIDWLEHPRSAVFLRYLPWGIGALAAWAYWQVMFVPVSVLGVEVSAPTLVLGALAGRFSEAGYLLVRERFPWLDAFTLTSEGPHRTRALLGAHQPPPPPLPTSTTEH